MVKEKRILTYFIFWLILGFVICFIGLNNVFAEVIQPIEMKSQIRTIYTDGTTQWYTSGSNTYTTPLYFGTGPSYSTFGIPCNFRLNVIHNIESSYSYKYSYEMHIFTPYSTNNTWDSSKIDEQYLLTVDDDQEVIKESKCTVINTTKNTNSLGTFMNKSISCIFTVNKNQSNAYVSAGYFCKGACNLTNMEPLGFIPQDSYISIDNVKIERFNDNSNIIIDQNQTIIDQNNKTNEELGNIKDQIEESNKETQEVIKDQFNNCYTNLFKGQFNQTNIIGQPIDLRLFAPDNYYIEAGKTYTFSTNVNLDGIMYGINLSTVPHPTSTENKVFDSGWQKGSVYTFTPDVSGYFGVLLAKNDPTQQLLLSEIESNWFMLVEGSTAKPYSPYGEKICSNKIDETNDKLDNLQGSLNNSNSSGATNDASNFFSNFTTDTFGLTSIVTSPLNLINSLTSSSCNDLNLPLPYLDNKYITLPCMGTIYSRYFGSFFNLYQTITFGIVAYWVVVRIFNQVKDFKNPEHDEIEVLDL